MVVLILIIFDCVFCHFSFRHKYLFYFRGSYTFKQDSAWASSFFDNKLPSCILPGYHVDSLSHKFLEYIHIIKWIEIDILGLLLKSTN